MIDQDGPCLVWLGDNGETFHLFQDPRIANDDFDRVTTPGVASRLELSVRTDLFVACEVGTIVEVGSGRRRAGDMTGILAARDRSQAGPTAPAHGLMLWRVRYPDDESVSSVAGGDQ